MSELMQILIKRDGLSRTEAAEAIAYARHLVIEGCDPEEVCKMNSDLSLIIFST